MNTIVICTKIHGTLGTLIMKTYRIHYLEPQMCYTEIKLLVQANSIPMEPTILALTASPILTSLRPKFLHRLMNIIL